MQFFGKIEKFGKTRRSEGKRMAFRSGWRKLEGGMVVFCRWLAMKGIMKAYVR